MSQLDLALAADVSSRHVSFLETARSRPSQEIVLRLGAALLLPLRDQNALLAASGLDPAFNEPDLPGVLSGPIAAAVERMLTLHAPYPMVVMDRHYNALRTNREAQALFAHFIANPSAAAPPLNLLRAVSDPRLARPFIENWQRFAQNVLSRLHREVLAQPSDRELAARLNVLLSFPDVPATWRFPEFAAGSEPVATLGLVLDDLRLSFLTTVTMFNAPQNMTIEELRIESYLPLDDESVTTCERLAG